MQPFLSRVSLTRSSCCFSGSFVSYSYRLSKATNTGTITRTVTNTGAADCPVTRKFGEFYQRFYSAISGAVPAGGDLGGQQHQPTTSNEGAAAGLESGAAGRRRRRRRAASRLGEAAKEDTPVVKLFKNMEKGRIITPTFGVGESPKRGKRRLHPTQRFIPKERRLFIERSTTRLTSRFLEHDRLCRELRADIKSRRIERNRALSHVYAMEKNQEIKGLEKTLSEEIKLLKKTLRYISTSYYESPNPGVNPSSEAETTTLADLENPEGTKTTPVPWFTPYLPPFPNYTSGANAVPLNRSLARLLRVRPPLPALIPKICYNLLTSPSPPNVHTYNILIEGLTHVRQGSLAHVVFRDMVEGGLGPKGKPDEGTIVRMLNLCVKTADREGFDRIAKIIAQRNMAAWWGLGLGRKKKTRDQKRRSKMILTALITGLARFGDVAQVRVYSRAMKRECPEDPDLGVFLLTSLIRMWTEMKNWDRGLRCWRDLMRLDLNWRCDRTHEPADRRAFHQMLRLCKTCGKDEMYSKVLTLAVSRGWEEKEVTEKPSKTKGLWVRRENKTPHIRDQRRDEGEGIEVLESLERGWDMEEFPPEEDVENAFATDDNPDDTDDAHADPEEQKKKPRRRRRHSSVSDAAKSKIWDGVLSRRMDDIRPEDVSGGDLRQNLAKQRREKKRAKDGGKDKGKDEK